MQLGRPHTLGIFVGPIHTSLVEVDYKFPKVKNLNTVLPRILNIRMYGKLVDNFSLESDVTSLQDPFTSRPYKTPF